MSKFTKGKWLLNKRLEVYTEDGLFIALCCIMPPRKKRYDDLNNDNVYNEETRANARLIAAAPEMYKWLKAFLLISKDGTAINTKHIKELLARIDEEAQQ